MKMYRIPCRLWSLIIQEVTNEEYKWGFTTDIDTEIIRKGLDEDVVRLISKKKNEPEWLLEFRLEAFRRWQKMKEPDWAHLEYETPNYQDIIYFAAPKQEKKKSIDEVDPELLATFDKLGIPLREREALAGVEPSGGVAYDAIMDSVSVKTTSQKALEEKGIIFMPISEAVQKHPDLVKKYLGSVVPSADNFFAALNSAVFSDGSFCYIPKGVRCPMELSSYFRINAKGTGQFERTLIVADEGAYVSYMEGCTAPQRDENQLHAAIVEIVVMKDAEVKYSTVQNWYPGDKNGKGGIYNFVTKRGICKGSHSKLSWTQVETGSAVTWKYPSCILQGDDSTAEFYSVAVTNNYQQGRRLDGRVLLGGRHQQLPAGRHRHQDDTCGQEHSLYHHEQGYFGRQEPQQLPRPGSDRQGGRQCPQLLAVRQPAAGRPMRRTYLALYQGRQPHGYP